MRKITFINQVRSAEFASRWKKEIRLPDFMGSDPTSHQVGRLGAKKIATNQIYDPDNFNNRYLVHPISPNRGHVLGSTIKNTQANRELYRIDKTPIVQESITNRLENYKANKKLKSSIVKYEPSPSKKSTTTKTINIKPKFKLGMKRKLGLGAVGLTTIGAIGYGLYRKIRSDKGKKRK